MRTLREIGSLAVELLLLLIPPVNTCGTSLGWRCTRWPSHAGACALRPRWFNIPGHLAYRRRHP